MKLLVIGLVLALGACSSSSSPAGVGTEASPGGTEGAPVMEPHAACDAYLSCLGAASPGALAAQLSAYGPDGSCWKSASLTETCGAACRTQLLELRGANPGVAQCAECTSDAACSDPARPHCSAELKCVACRSKSDCTDPGKPICKLATERDKMRGVLDRCVACITDSDCAGTGRCGATGECTPSDCRTPLQGPEIRDLAACNACRNEKCSTEYTECFGADWERGNYAGPCASFLDCLCKHDPYDLSASTACKDPACDACMDKYPSCVGEICKAECS